MRKNNTRETMTRNLTDATRAGIWMHCFLFFGFPGETEVDEQETYDFVMSRSSVIGSIGCGTFSLEHNAPIFKHFADFGVSLAESSRNNIDVYYEYETTTGITPDRASEWMDVLNGEALKIPRYRAASWVAREHLLCLLARMSADELVEHGSSLWQLGQLPATATLPEFINSEDLGDRSLLISNRLNGRVLKLSGNYEKLVRFLLQSECSVGTLFEVSPEVLRLFSSTDPVPALV
jgi:anaerobic magnesium-protoporphyrin IX monomethyl ester cyclase